MELTKNVIKCRRKTRHADRFNTFFALPCLLSQNRIHRWALLVSHGVMTSIFQVKWNHPCPLQQHQTKPFEEVLVAPLTRLRMHYSIPTELRRARHVRSSSSSSDSGDNLLPQEPSFSYIPPELRPANQVEPASIATDEDDLRSSNHALMDSVSEVISDGQTRKLQRSPSCLLFVFAVLVGVGIGVGVGVSQRNTNSNGPVWNRQSAILRAMLLRCPMSFFNVNVRKLYLYGRKKLGCNTTVCENPTCRQSYQRLAKKKTRAIHQTLHCGNFPMTHYTEQMRLIIDIY